MATVDEIKTQVCHYTFKVFSMCIGARDYHLHIYVK